MALSDYLTGDEWDACYYVAMVAHKGENFGDAMHQTITALLKNGYRFSGLDEYGMKMEQVEGGVNAPKILLFLGNPNKIDPLPILDNGRRFLKLHCPELVVVGTDAEWEGLMARTAAQLKEKQ